MSDERQVWGTLIEVAMHSREPAAVWHYSVEYDGRVHRTACDQLVACDRVHDAEMRVVGNTDKDPSCAECWTELTDVLPDSETHD